MLTLITESGMREIVDGEMAVNECSEIDLNSSAVRPPEILSEHQLRKCACDNYKRRAGMQGRHISEPV